MVAFVEVARDVYVLRYPVLDVNVTLIVGGDAAVVVDTLSTEAQATELLAAVRMITRVPLIVVNTHAHFDHCFGNAAFARNGAEIWAHTQTAMLLRECGEQLRREANEMWGPTSPELAAGLLTVRIEPPDREVDTTATIDLGGRLVVLEYLGRGHTGGDLVVLVPDTAVVVAGDLIEESGPPQFGDAYPLQWPQTVATLLGRVAPTAQVVPGHGAVVGREFLVGQHRQLATLANLLRKGYAAGLSREAVAARAPFDPVTAQTAVARGYAELSE